MRKCTCIYVCVCVCMRKCTCIYVCACVRECVSVLLCNTKQTSSVLIDLSISLSSVSQSHFYLSILIGCLRFTDLYAVLTFTNTFYKLPVYTHLGSRHFEHLLGVSCPFCNKNTNILESPHLLYFM